MKFTVFPEEKQASTHMYNFYIIKYIDKIYIKDTQSTN